MLIQPPYRAMPKVLPYDPATVTPAVVMERLRAMTSPDTNTRVEAFSGLRDVPDGVLERAWRAERGALPPLGYETDCLERLFVPTAGLPVCPGASRAIVTVATPGFEPMLDTLLLSLRKWGGADGQGGPSDAPVIVFAAGETADWVREHHPQVTVLACLFAAPPSAAVKGVLYSCARWIGAETILALECDMLVLAPLAPLWQAVEALRPGVLAGCRSQVEAARFTLREVFGHMDCPQSDWEWLTGERDGPQGLFSFNGGLLCGHRSAWEALDRDIRAMGPRAVLWTEGAFYEGFRDELLMNLCLARRSDTAELPAEWNVQLCDGARDHWFQTTRQADGMLYTRLGKPAKVLHFVGAQRRFLRDVLAETEQFGLSAAYDLMRCA